MNKGKAIRAAKVHLQIKMDDTRQQWRLVVPKSAHLDINLGVGELDVHY